MAATTEKLWYESRTLWVNAIGLIVVVLEYLGTINLPVLTPETVAFLLAIVNIVLRFVTSTPVARTIR